MTALEIRLIGYALLLLAIVSGSAWAGYKLTAIHYEGAIARDKAAQNEALQSAQQNVIIAQRAQAAAEQQAEKDHAILVQADTASRNAILGSVRSLEAALHLGGLPGSVDHPGQPGGTASGTGGPDGLADFVGRLNDSIAKATAACQHDSAELAGILQVAPHPVSPP